NNSFNSINRNYSNNNSSSNKVGREDDYKKDRLEALILSNPQQIIIGYDNYRDKFYAIPSSCRVHMLITGETGSGKSETLKLLIYQHILRREGFMLIDPHGSLARSVLKLLREKLTTEEEFNKEVIYINPEVTNWKINPLEIKDYSKSHIVVMSFISALKNLYDYAWGDRLETILRNTINLVVESDPPCTLAKIAKVLADSKYRDMLVKGSADKDMEYFWYSVYPNYAREAFTAVYNKLDKLLSIASVRKTFNVEVSNLDIEEAVENNKVIIVDLASGFTDDITKFLASLFIHMLYITARRRIDKYEIEELESKDKQYYLYMDEAQIIATFAIREVLNALRKFNIKVTLATQTINAFDKQVQKELPALCRSIICFRSDPDTAEAFAYLFSVKPEQIYTLPLHYFYFYSQGEEVTRGLAKSYVI
ncbi:MAG: ATP-binding protein, partial [Candidatus Nitrosocaldaceae archaeon]